MFEAKIVVHASDAVFKLIDPIFASLAPKEIRNPFDSTGQQNLKFRAKIIRTDDIKEIDDYHKAPHLIIYFFDSQNKQEFQKNESAKIKEWTRKYDRSYVPSQIIFVDDPKKTKTNNFFGTGSNYVPFLQQECKDLIVLPVKADGTLKKKVITEKWKDIADDIKIGLIKRVETLKEKTITPDSLDTFKLVLSLTNIFDDLGLFDSSFGVLQHTKVVILQKKEKIAPCFINEESLTHQFDMCRGSDDVEKHICNTQNVPLYDLLFIIFKRQMQCYLSMQKPWLGIQALWDFLVFVEPQAMSSGLLTPIELKLWLCQALNDLIAGCGNERAMGRNQRVNIFIAALEWYLRLIPELYEGREQLPKEFKFKVSNEIKNLLTSEEEFKKYMQVYYEKLGGIHTMEGNLRAAAIAAQKELFYSQDEKKKRTLIATMTRTAVIGQNPEYIAPHVSDDFRTLNRGEMLRAAARSLSNGNKDSVPAAELLSSFLDTQQTEQCEISLRIPVYVTVKEDQKPIRGEEGTFSFIIHTCFKETIKCNKMKLVLEDQDGNRESLRNKSGEVSEGAEIQLTGKFKKAGSFKPIQLHLYAGRTILVVGLINTDTYIDVEEPLPAFDVLVQLPEYLLPCWQHALVTFVLTKEDTLSLRVAGIQSKITALHLQNGNEIKPTVGVKNSWIFQNIPVGRHELYMPVLANKAGELKIEVTSQQLKVERIQHYEVSAFLTIAVVYKPSSSVAMLTAYTDAARGMQLEDCKFLDTSGKQLESEATGIPAPVGTSARTAIFEVDGTPETACVTLSQKGLKPFTLRFNIENVEDSDVSPPAQKAVTPLTCVLPETSNPFGI